MENDNLGSAANSQADASSPPEIFCGDMMGLANDADLVIRVYGPIPPLIGEVFAHALTPDHQYEVGIASTRSYITRRHETSTMLDASHPRSVDCVSIRSTRRGRVFMSLAAVDLPDELLSDHWITFEMQRIGLSRLSHDELQISHAVMADIDDRFQKIPPLERSQYRLDVTANLDVEVGTAVFIGILRRLAEKTEGGATPGSASTAVKRGA
ncbi:hypothetical protein ACFL51_00085 [Myxococcota bacterium]